MDQVDSSHIPLENSLVVPQNMKEVSYWNSTLRELKHIITQKFIHELCTNSIIHNSQKWKPKCLSTDKWVKKNSCSHTMAQPKQVIR